MINTQGLTKAEKIEEILRLKKEKNAVILAHYYQDYDVQQVADHFGDSFELAKKAMLTENEMIVFCGVSFMAESAKILNPAKKVLATRADAGCAMADMITAEQVMALKAAHPDAAVACYVNSTAETKAVSDICVTSANAVRICRQIPEKKIIFVPDKNLGSYVASVVKDKEFIIHSGYCPIHDQLTAEDVAKVRAVYPNAKLTVHPEAQKEILGLADFVGSTSQIINYCAKSPDEEFIIGTEIGVIARLENDYPGKKFYPLTACAVCPDMKKTSLDDVLYVLSEEANEVVLTPEKIAAAHRPLERMMSVK